MSQTPLPVIVANRLLQNLNYPVLTVGGTLAAVLLSLFFLTGALFPTESGALWGDRLELTGIMLLLSFMPPYLLMCYLASLRSSGEAYAKIQTLLDDDAILQSIRFRRARFWPLAVILAGTYGLALNVNWDNMDFSTSTERMLVSLSLIGGQFFMWIIVGMVLYLRVIESLVWHRLAAHVTIDVYDLDKLNGFGREALNNFLMVVGALALTTFQSINRQFDIYNYLYALLVAIPAIIVLVTLPIWGIQRRIRGAKREHLENINNEIAVSSRELDQQSLARMNALLQRRELLESLRNWPMDLSIVARFVLYVFIVPLAWAGAALTEVILDAMLGL